MWGDRGQENGLYSVCTNPINAHLLIGGLISDFAISPDGSQIAYSMPSGIEIADLSGQPAGNIPGPDQVSSPSWSPDGQYMAFIVSSERRDSLWVRHIESGVESVSPIPDGFEHPTMRGNGSLNPGFVRVAWSPTEWKLALLSNYGSVYVLKIDCEASTHVCNGADIRLLGKEDFRGYVSWSPDGTQLASTCYNNFQDGYLSICIIDSAIGQLNRAFRASDLGLPSNAILNDPIWSPDGRQIVFTNGPDVYAYSLEDETLTNLTSGLFSRGTGEAILLSQANGR